MYDSMNLWFVSISVMLFWAIRSMLGRKSSTEIAWSGSYMGRSIRGYAITSPSSSPASSWIQGGTATRNRPRWGIVTAGSTAATIVEASAGRSSAAGTGRCAAASLATRRAKESRSAVLKRPAVGLSVPPVRGRRLEPGSESAKSGLFGSRPTARGV